jgi:hypothetical protein
MSTAPVETKVTVAAVAAATAGFVMWALDQWVFRGSTPDAVRILVYVLVPGLASFAAGWSARHTYRQAPGPVQNLGGI